MRSKSPELMSEIKKYIEDYYLQNRQSPSTTKIAEAVGIARGTAYKYLVEMAEKNMIEYDGQEISTNVTRKYSGEQTQTPIVGSIPCGSPQYEEENIEEYVSLPTAIFGKGDFFILRASGQSMIEAGIDDGDLVVGSTPTIIMTASNSDMNFIFVFLIFMIMCSPQFLIFSVF